MQDHDSAHRVLNLVRELALGLAAAVADRLFPMPIPALVPIRRQQASIETTCWRSERRG